MYIKCRYTFPWALDKGQIGSKEMQNEKSRHDRCQSQGILYVYLASELFSYFLSINQSINLIK